jgi:hypothetical protein
MSWWLGSKAGTMNGVLRLKTFGMFIGFWEGARGMVIRKNTTILLDPNTKKNGVKCSGQGD